MRGVSLILRLPEIELSTGRDLINFKTVSTSQIKEYLARGGLWLNTRHECIHTGMFNHGYSAYWFMKC